MSRFSLLLLEHGELVLESALCALRMEEEEDFQDGRLFLCTKSLFFEPQSSLLPIIRFPLSAMGVEPKCLEASNAIAFRTKKLVEIKPKTPYHVRALAVAKSISCELKHTRASKFCLLISQLFAFKQQKREEADGLYREIVQPRLSEAFDRSRMVDFRERVVLPKLPSQQSGLEKDAVIMVERVEPLVTVYGCALLTDSRIYFQHCRLNNISGQARQCSHWNLKDLKQVNTRRYLMNEVGLELKLASGSSSSSNEEEVILLAFTSQAFRDEFYTHICDIASQQHGLKPRASLEEYTRQWQLGALDNFDYLTRLNEFADRSKLDITQYPVFPWVLSDYTSAELDLGVESTFRDLSKPIGALNEQRLRQFQSRYKEMVHLQEDARRGGGGEEGEPLPPFLYGTHYSTPGFVLFYLIRERADEALRLQNGKFDSPDRMFHSLDQVWQNCLNNAADVKELIPEFYSGTGSFLLNSHRLDFGKRAADGVRVNDVVLPPWANHSPQEFVRKMRLALESEYVSANLHLWIDLIFGVDQRSIERNNVFFHLTYPPPEATTSGTSLGGGAGEMNEAARQANEAQIMEFGQTPKQLFSQKHPARAHHFEDVGVLPPRQAPAKLAVPHSVEAAPSLLLEKEPARDKWPSSLNEELPRAERSAATLRFNGDAPILAACISQDYHILACGDGSLQFLNSKGEVSRRVRLSKLALSSLALVGDDDEENEDLLIGSWDNSLCRYSVKTGRVLFRVDNAHDDAVSSISAAKGMVCTGGWDSAVKLWREEQCVAAYYSHECAVSSVSFENSLVLSSDVEGGILVHDPRQPHQDAVWQTRLEERNAVEQVAWLPGSASEFLCSSKRSGLLALFDLRRRNAAVGSNACLVAKAQSAKWEPTCFATDGTQVLVGDSLGRITLCNSLLDKLDQVLFESSVVMRRQQEAAGSGGGVAVSALAVRNGRLGQFELLSCTASGHITSLQVSS